MYIFFFVRRHRIFNPPTEWISHTYPAKPSVCFDNNINTSKTIAVCFFHTNPHTSSYHGFSQLSYFTHFHVEMPSLETSEAAKVGAAEDITSAHVVNKLLDELLASARAENAATAQQERDREPLDQLLARLGLDRTAAAKRDTDKLKKVIRLLQCSVILLAFATYHILCCFHLSKFFGHRPSSFAARPPSRRLLPL
jgi:hypothetical protein